MFDEWKFLNLLIKINALEKDHFQCCSLLSTLNAFLRGAILKHATLNPQSATGEQVQHHKCGR